MRRFIFLILLFFPAFGNLKAQTGYFENGVVSSANETASNVGIDILKNGGNAIDAAVGTGFALAVVYPQAGNIGGGGFMVIHLSDGRNTSIDYREKAPLRAYREMYLNQEGDVIMNLSTLGNLAAGVPGSVAGMLYALEKYGTKKREEILKYSYELAENGFYINRQLADNLNSYQKDFQNFSGTMEIFGGNFKEGDLLIQKDLAKTLKRIIDYGADGFYGNETAGLIVDEMINSNGIISYDDLAGYEAKERNVIEGTYREYKIISMGPPSSGGISLVYLLNILENFDLKKNGFGSADNINIMTEAMRRVYADRSEFMGDADFVSVPFDILTNKNYAVKRMNDFKEGHAGSSSEIKHGDAYYRESDQTTHFSVADKSGNLVSVTTTLNDVFGNKVVVKGAGFFLNNEMDDFVSKPGSPNIYGLVGNEANSIQPGKRMLSSMTPALIFKNDKPFLILGSPGGGRIITTVLQTLVNIIDFNMSLKEAVDAPRFHHQWLPDEIQIEKNFTDGSIINQLEKMGYTVRIINDFGKVDAVQFAEDGRMTGYSDKRGSGKAVGY